MDDGLVKGDTIGNTEINALRKKCQDLEEKTSGSGNCLLNMLLPIPPR